MKEKILIVDAYNMIGNWPELARLKKSDRLEDARDQLLLILSDYHKQSDSKIIVVFDAMYVPGLSKSYKQYNLDVVWTDEGQTADSYIERVVAQTPKYRTVRVATSDGLEQSQILSTGATRLTSRELPTELRHLRESTLSAHRNQTLGMQKKPIAGRLPEETLMIREKLRRSEN